MKELSLKEIQLVQLDILSTVASICEQQNLKYFLHYGTLIGAIRHKGFIPWDDDLDIVMPRLDYEKLLEYWKHNYEKLKPLELLHYSTNKKYIYPIIRISDSRYYIENSNENYGFGIFIDIYPFDGCGNTEEEALKIWLKNKNDISVIHSGVKTKFEKSPFGTVRNVIKFLMYVYTKVFGLNRVLRRVDKKSRQHDFNKDSLSYCTVWGSSYKYVQPKTDFEEWIYVKFEGRSFRTFKNYDEVLRRIYGDYMQLPPEEERIGHHNYKAYLKN